MPWLALALTISTLTWLAVMIADLVVHGPREDLEAWIAYLDPPPALHWLSYANAALLTALTVALFSSLDARYRDEDERGWLKLSVAFIPIYGALNLVAYLSQITVVPALVDAQANPELLRLALHQLPGSAVELINTLAYAALGVPSVALGAQMLHEHRLGLRLSALALLSSAAASELGLIGLLTRVPALHFFVVVSGALFTLALIALTTALFQARHK